MTEAVLAHGLMGKREAGLRAIELLEAVRIDRGAAQRGQTGSEARTWHAQEGQAMRWGAMSTNHPAFGPPGQR